MGTISCSVGNTVSIRHDAVSVTFQGLDAKLAGVEGAEVIKGILV